MSSIWRLFSGRGSHEPEEIVVQKQQQEDEEEPQGETWQGDTSADAEGGEVLIQDSNPRTLKRTRIVRERVPYIRKVKVPVTLKRIDEPRVQMGEFELEVDVLKPQFVEVEERYVEMEEREEVRTREVWVPKTVEERVLKRVPVEKSRLIKKQVDVVEREKQTRRFEWEQGLIIEAPGYRIDEVEEWKTIEHEKVEEYELVEQHIRSGTSDKVSDYKFISSTKNLNRKIGQQVFFPGDADLDTIPLDKETTGTIYMTSSRSIDELPRDVKHSIKVVEPVIKKTTKRKRAPEKESVHGGRFLTDAKRSRPGWDYYPFADCGGIPSTPMASDLAGDPDALIAEAERRGGIAAVSTNGWLYKSIGDLAAWHNATWAETRNDGTYVFNADTVRPVQEEEVEEEESKEVEQGEDAVEGVSAEAYLSTKPHLASTPVKEPIGGGFGSRLARITRSASKMKARV